MTNKKIDLNFVYAEEHDVTKKIMKSKSNTDTTVDNRQSTPKRRGRRPKKILDENDVLDLPGNGSIGSRNDFTNAADSMASNRDPAVILRLRNPASMKMPAVPIPDPKLHSEQLSEHSNSDSSDGMFHNDIPIDSICHK